MNCIPITITTPESTPTVSSEQTQSLVYQHEELVAYALELINKDREANGLAHVILGDNMAILAMMGMPLLKHYKFFTERWFTRFWIAATAIFQA